MKNEEYYKNRLDNIKTLHISILDLIFELGEEDLNKLENAALIGYTFDMLIQSVKSIEIFFELIPNHLLEIFQEELKQSFPESEVLNKLNSN
jgi:hypothetical protein